MADKTIDESLFQLKKQIEIAEKTGMRGAQMSQRIEGDLNRLMNSAWLNLAELISDHESQNA